jgi:hypothetical protein
MTTIVAPRHAGAVLGSNEIRVEGRVKVSGKQKYTAGLKLLNMVSIGQRLGE